MNKHAPLELPSGSFELSDLEKIGEQAANAGSESERTRVIRDGLAAANQRVDQVGVSGILPDHVTMPVNRVIQEGTERQLPDGGTETVGRIVVQEEAQVYDPEAAAAAQPGREEGAVAAAEGATDTGSAGAGV
jgi:hypothetical protein